VREPWTCPAQCGCLSRDVVHDGQPRPRLHSAAAFRLEWAGQFGVLERQRKSRVPYMAKYSTSGTSQVPKSTAPMQLRTLGTSSAARMASPSDANHSHTGPTGRKILDPHVKDKRPCERWPQVFLDNCAICHRAARRFRPSFYAECAGGSVGTRRPRPQIPNATSTRCPWTLLIGQVSGAALRWRIFASASASSPVIHQAR